MAINPSSGAIAELINISKIYGEGATQVRAVNELNLKVFKGDYLAVM
ncbi:MAG: macrolide ABC transporter ATP-binding protein, partial [Synechococcaceae bacterium WB9_2_069]|nr:macrolide ABC transporter ATP-binding protein [Synechococcaceae bacterium WB9_2_069]